MEEAKKKRSSQPWIIAYQHRPIFCSDKYNQCNGSDNNQLRYDSPGNPALEPVYAEYGVDMVFAGHHHFYERQFPRSHRHTTIQTNPHVNAKAPVYVVSGSAGGAPGHHSSFHARPSPLSAVRKTENSYTVLHLHNKTHLFMKQISVEGRPKEIDRLWLIKSPGYSSGYG
ncbi:unnamed protein product [Bursaphelenchus xylophilus]|uniref:(pine wood nematode) hypothetical protein n=1 Tax=Bursaphelenchus xylophilus TaxID=6326 RepID=A0A1I7RMC1_BURXY|nr:unnamed protein product [Bursaphelenchus xylophilus]CAG9118367.1 unnamed protein product [Bursaphelenchus xylophilus]